MKDKIFKFLGEVIYVIAKALVALTIMIIVSIIVFEKQKAEIWLEVAISFEELYQTKVEELHESLGIVDQDQEWKYDTQNISLAPEKQNDDYPTLEEEASAICIDKLMEAKQVIGPKELMEIYVCVHEQLQAAKIILHSYFFYAEGLADDNPTKVILQKIIVECNNSNTNTEGYVDQTNMLECLRSEIERLNEMLDRDLHKFKRQHGI